MSNALNRAFKISDGLAHLAGKKLKAAVSELQKEGIITSQEGSKIVGQMTKVKRSIYDNASKELKKLLAVASKKASKPAKKKKRI